MHDLNGNASVVRDLNILLVDDDQVDVLTVERAFEKAHTKNRLFIARDGIEALEMLRGDAIPRERRLVLLDLNMPRMNGIELLRALRNDPKLKHTAVVVMTTSTDDRDRLEAYKQRIAGYVVKPVTFHAFEEVMAALDQYWRLMEL